jgi:hypothetical protein
MIAFPCSRSVTSDKNGSVAMTNGDSVLVVLSVVLDSCIESILQKK